MNPTWKYLFAVHFPSKKVYQSKIALTALAFETNASLMNRLEKLSSAFAGQKVASPDQIFLTKAMYLADPDKSKINLGIGAYRTDEGVPFVLDVVRQAEKRIAADPSLNHEYQAISGMSAMVSASQALILGADCPAIAAQRVAGCQTLSGTGALRVLAEFINKSLPGAKIYYSRPTWGNHAAIFSETGVPTGTYAYWKPETRGLDIESMLADISHAPRGSVILLHACAHNPTGVDPTIEQWASILKVVQNRGHIAFFDSAYQGFASGDLSRDAAAVQMFVRAGVECLIAQSFAKNMGLYGERVGCASIVCKNATVAKAVNSQLPLVIRPMYSNPPTHGARIVTMVLTDPDLFKAWTVELRGMSVRIQEMRALLLRELTRLKTPSVSGDWTHITSQIGMFSFTGLTVPQVENITKRHHVYMLKNGRISMAGVNSGNVVSLARAMDDVVRNT